VFYVCFCRDLLTKKALENKEKKKAQDKPKELLSSNEPRSSPSPPRSSAPRGQQSNLGVKKLKNMLAKDGVPEFTGVSVLYFALKRIRPSLKRIRITLKREGGLSPRSRGQTPKSASQRNEATRAQAWIGRAQARSGSVH